MKITNFAWNAERQSCNLTVEFYAQTLKDAHDLAELIQIGDSCNEVFSKETSGDEDAEWFGTGELAGLPDMPCSCQGVLRKAKKQKWLMRIKPNCSKATQIHISNLPPATIAALRGETYE